MKRVFTFLASVALVVASATAVAKWNPAEVEEYDAKAQVVIVAVKESDPKMQKFFDVAVGYVVIPTVGKAALGVGGARGKGLLYEGGVPTAVVTLTQLSFGFQGGAQAYSEFIFFEDAKTLDTFKNGNFELNAQASAVAVTTGASADAAFKGGMAIFRPKAA